MRCPVPSRAGDFWDNSNAREDAVEISKFKELFLAELQELLSAEQQLSDVLLRMAGAACLRRMRRCMRTATMMAASSSGESSEAARLGSRDVNVMESSSGDSLLVRPSPRRCVSRRINSMISPHNSASTTNTRPMPMRVSVAPMIFSQRSSAEDCPSGMPSIRRSRAGGRERR